MPVFRLPPPPAPTSDREALVWLFRATDGPPVRMAERGAARRFSRYTFNAKPVRPPARSRLMVRKTARARRRSSARRPNARMAGWQCVAASVAMSSTARTWTRPAQIPRRRPPAPVPALRRRAAPAPVPAAEAGAREAGRDRTAGGLVRKLDGSLRRRRHSTRLRHAPQPRMKALAVVQIDEPRRAVRRPPAGKSLSDAVGVGRAIRLGSHELPASWGWRLIQTRQVSRACSARAGRHPAIRFAQPRQPFPVSTWPPAFLG